MESGVIYYYCRKDGKVVMYVGTDNDGFSYKYILNRTDLHKTLLDKLNVLELVPPETTIAGVGQKGHEFEYTIIYVPRRLDVFKLLPYPSAILEEGLFFSDRVYMELSRAYSTSLKKSIASFKSKTAVSLLRSQTRSSP